MKLVTSNKNKLKEFQRFGLDNIQMEQGKDIDEVDSDPVTVILYKALEVGAGHLVEDTSLHVSGADVGVNVRWLLDNIAQYNEHKAVWEVLLGYNDGENIRIYQGVIKGELTDALEGVSGGFGFDTYFIPEGSSQTLYELELINKKDFHSARRLAVDSLISDSPIKVVAIKDIPTWTGKYQ